MKKNDEAKRTAQAVRDAVLTDSCTRIMKAVSDYRDLYNYPAGTVIEEGVMSILTAAKISSKKLKEHREAEELAHARLMVMAMKHELKELKEAPLKKLSNEREWLW